MSQQRIKPSCEPEMSVYEWFIKQRDEIESVCPTWESIISFDQISKYLISQSSFPVMTRLRVSLKMSLFGYILLDIPKSFENPISYFNFPFWASKTINLLFPTNPDINSFDYLPNQAHVVGVSKLFANISLC